MRTGRPKVENPKNLNVTVRFDAPTFKELEEYCKRENKSKADATRNGVRLLLDTDKQRRGDVSVFEEEKRRSQNKHDDTS